jgi:hypothetical protein
MTGVTTGGRKERDSILRGIAIHVTQSGDPFIMQLTGPMNINSIASGIVLRLRIKNK